MIPPEQDDFSMVDFPYHRYNGSFYRELSEKKQVFPDTFRSCIPKTTLRSRRPFLREHAPYSGVPFLLFRHSDMKNVIPHQIRHPV